MCVYKIVGLCVLMRNLLCWFLLIFLASSFYFHSRNTKCTTIVAIVSRFMCILCPIRCVIMVVGGDGGGGVDDVTMQTRWFTLRCDLFHWNACAVSLSLFQHIRVGIFRFVSLESFTEKNRPTDRTNEWKKITFFFADSIVNHLRQSIFNGN